MIQQVLKSPVNINSNNLQPQPQRILRDGFVRFASIKQQPQKDCICFTGSIVNPFSFSTRIDPVVAKQIETIENDIKARGINAELEKTNLPLALVIKEGIEDIEKAGFILPDKVKTETEIFLPFLKKGMPATGFFRFHNPDKPLDNDIIYNPLLDWTKPIADQPPKHHIYHEIGHYLHFKKDPQLYMKLFRTSGQYKFKDDLKEMIRQEVSNKATENITEFVADVFAGLMQGKRYNDKVMNYYKGFGGAVPPGGWDSLK